MGEIHDLLEAKGKQACLDLALRRPIVEAASAYLGDEDPSKAFIFSGWTQAALPHKKLPDEEVWTIKSDRVTLVVEPGRRLIRDTGKTVLVGVPYGSRARLIMLYLQTQALKTGSREVELGRSLRVWLGRMDISIGGKSVQAVKEQAERISRCRLTFHANIGKGHGLVNQNIVDAAMFDGEGEAASSFTDKILLSDGFFKQLQKHPVPLEEAAIGAISNNSMALDIYCWLAYRLHILDAAITISWPALHGQFGSGFLQQKTFKQNFQLNLQLALAVYRDARTEVTERGVTLHPSRPPVASRATVRLK